MNTRTSAAVEPLLVLTTTIGTVAWAAWASTGRADAAPAVAADSPTAHNRLTTMNRRTPHTLLERGQRERKYPLRTGTAELTADHRERPAGDAAVVEERAQPRGRRGHDFERTPDVGGLLGGVGHLALWRPLVRASHELDVWDGQRLGDASPQPRDNLAEADRGHRRDPVDAARSPAHVRHRLDHVLRELAALQAALESRPPPAVAKTRQRPPRLDEHVRGDLAHHAAGVGRHLAHLELDRRGAQVPSGGFHQRRIERGVESPTGAYRAAAAVLRRGVVELILEHPHEAATVGAERCHRALLGAAERGHLGVPLAVVGPTGARHQSPSAPGARDRALDVEDLEHRLDPAHAEVDYGHQLAGRPPVLAGGFEFREHRGYPLAVGKRLLDEEVLDPAVLAAPQQDDVGVFDAAAGATDLLVVGDDRPGRLVVHDERQVGLVVAHAKRARGDHRLDLVAEQPVLGVDPVAGLLFAAVGHGGDSLGAQESRDLVGVALGERVHDPGAVHAREVRRQPRQSFRGPR